MLGIIIRTQRLRSPRSKVTDHRVKRMPSLQVLLDGRITTYSPFKCTCEGGTDQYSVSVRYMYKGEGRSTPIEHEKTKIPGGTAYGMDML